MTDKEPIWDAIVRKYGLKPYKFREIVSWRFGDMQFQQNWDSIVATSKIRRFGFHEVVEDEEMFFPVFQTIAGLENDPLAPPSIIEIGHEMFAVVRQLNGSDSA
jgi:hypothetical protein